jgi:hypothetical protein
MTGFSSHNTLAQGEHVAPNLITKKGEQSKEGKPPENKK